MARSICDKILDPVKKKRCLQRVRSEQSTGASSKDETVKSMSKKGSKKIRSGRY